MQTHAVVNLRRREVLTLPPTTTPTLSPGHAPSPVHLLTSSPRPIVLISMVATAYMAHFSAPQVTPYIYMYTCMYTDMHAARRGGAARGARAGEGHAYAQAYAYAQHGRRTWRTLTLTQFPNPNPNAVLLQHEGHVDRQVQPDDGALVCNHRRGDRHDDVVLHPLR